MLTKDKKDGNLLGELLSIWLDETITQQHYYQGWQTSFQLILSQTMFWDTVA